MLVQKSAFFVLASMATSAGSVLIVDATVGPYFDIQSAVDASSDGDVVLVRSGTYPAFAVVSRTVAVAADTGASVTVHGAIRVRNLDAGETFVAAGLRAVGLPGTGFTSNGLTATSCDGAVRIQDCELRGADSSTCVLVSGSMPAGIEVRECADVAISRTLLVGGSRGGGYWGTAPAASGPGVELDSSRIALHESTARGPTGGSGGGACPDGASGGNGATLSSGSELFALAGSFDGGAGGAAAHTGLQAWGGNGGIGFQLVNTCPESSLARTIESTFLGGAAGQGWCNGFGCGDGSDYDGLWGAPASVGTCAERVVLTGTAPKLACASVVRENTALALAVTGAPGSEVWLQIARSTAHEWEPTRQGVRLVQGVAPARWLRLGTVAANGMLSAALPIAPLPVVEQGRVFHLQVLAIAPDGAQQLGSARTVVVVDSAI